MCGGKVSSWKNNKQMTFCFIFISLFKLKFKYLSLLRRPLLLYKYLSFPLAQVMFGFPFVFGVHFCFPFRAVLLNSLLPLATEMK